MQGELDPLQSGDLLIAPPNMPDSRFRESVIMLTHQAGGMNFGICLNRPSRYTISDLRSEAPIPVGTDFNLYWGGPVNPQTIWMLHSSDWHLDNTLRINSQWSMTSNFEMFNFISEGSYPQYFRIFFGYCSWAPNQLESEIAGDPPWSHNNSWLIWRNPDSQQLFDLEEDMIWRVSAEQCAKQAVNDWL